MLSGYNKEQCFYNSSIKDMRFHESVGHWDETQHQMLTKITPCQTRHGVGGSRVTSRTFEGRAFAKYERLFCEIRTAPRAVSWSIHGLDLPPCFLYTFHRTNLIICSVFAAYFDCEILHLAFVWRLASFAAGMLASGQLHEFEVANLLFTNRTTLFHDAATLLDGLVQCYHFRIANSRLKELG